MSHRKRQSRGHFPRRGILALAEGSILSSMRLFAGMSSSSQSLHSSSPVLSIFTVGSTTCFVLKFGRALRRKRKAPPPLSRPSPQSVDHLLHRAQQLFNVKHNMASVSDLQVSCELCTLQRCPLDRLSLVVRSLAPVLPPISHTAAAASSLGSSV